MSALGCDQGSGYRRTLAEYLANHGGRCTHRQWHRITCLLKKTIADKLTAEMVYKTKRHYIAKLLAIIFMLSGCAGSTGNIHADAPIERGLSYIAAAIVTSGVLRAIFNK